MAADDGWLARMSAEERRRFTESTRRLFALHGQVKSVSEAAMLERVVVDAVDPVEARAYWRALSGHYRELTDLHRELADVTAAMAATLDGLCD
jgi:uncharacterized protein (DUF1810 family)